MKGRPTTYTPELGEEIANRCVLKSLNLVCKAEDMPARSTVYLWLVQHKDFSDKYARAREARAFRRSESVDEIMQKVRKGVIDAPTGRLLLDAIKWQTAKENVRAFGDKIEHSGNADAPLTVVVRKFSE